MTAQTARYNLTYATDSDEIRKLPSILKTMAESVDSALDKFDYRGGDTSGLTPRVASLETHVQSLLSKTPVMLSCAVSSATLTVKNTHNRINIQPPASEPSIFYVSNNRVRLQQDALLCMTVNIRINNRTDHRRFVQIVKNWESGQPSASQELARSSFGTEDLITLTAFIKGEAEDTFSISLYQAESDNTTITDGTFAVIAFPS